MAGINDYGDVADDLSAPQLGGPSGWAAAVAAVLNGSDTTVDDRIADRGHRITRPNVDDRLVEQWNGSAWSVVDYDSGWRNVLGSIINGWAPSVANIRRINNQIHFYVRNADATNATSDIILDLRALNLGVGQSGSAIFDARAGYEYVCAWLSSTYAISARRSHITASMETLSGTVITDDPLPTSLPGTLVTPAPE